MSKTIQVPDELGQLLGPAKTYPRPSPRRWSWSYSGASPLNRKGV